MQDRYLRLSASISDSPSLGLRKPLLRFRKRPVIDILTLALGWNEGRFVSTGNGEMCHDERTGESRGVLASGAETPG